MSFELYWHSEPLLIDSGTYTYDITDNNYREYFRSTDAHNTIIVNEKAQFYYTGNLGSKNLPDISLEKIDENTFKGKLLLNDDAKISREINIEKDSIFVTDIVNSKRKDNIIKIVLNFHPDNPR